MRMRDSKGRFVSRFSCTLDSMIGAIEKRKEIEKEKE